jgi:hypothetical protein
MAGFSNILADGFTSLKKLQAVPQSPPKVQSQSKIKSKEHQERELGKKEQPNQISQSIGQHSMESNSLNGIGQISSATSCSC